ncbi:hypothetical protein AB833_21590 [Chromatiales bacterium (ex Bugula neritina AB1)]|nr:hypothetical protein AB833_21590 [Chromatiales bacterium (ex Bugula neritina AB1)]
MLVIACDFGISELLALGAGAETDVRINAGEPVYNSEFALAETSAAVLAAIAAAVNEIWQLKTGRAQQAIVDGRCAATALDSYRFLQRRGRSGQYETLANSPAAENAYRITKPFPTRDGRWFLPHFGLLHLKSKMLKLLNCTDNPESVAASIARWESFSLEDAVAGIGACGGVVRSPDEWLDHPQGRAVATAPVIAIEKIADSEARPFRTDGPPLHGVRVLDLTRILAGPVAARTCAEQGADVLMIAAQHTPQIKNFVMDLSHGKRSCFLDLDEKSDAAVLRSLVSGCDVFSQGYRPGALQARGFGAHELAAICPGIIYLTTSCYGQHGPWAERAGWEQVAQAVSGICHEVDPQCPGLLPVNACDYITGYLGAYGILLALLRRAREGGSYHVNVSLCQTAMFLGRQSRRLPGAEVSPLSDAEIALFQTQSETAYGSLRHLAPVINFSETKAQWLRPTPALGSDLPHWL